MSSEGNITVIESFSADDTHALGVTLGQQAKPGDVCTLVGDLGVGKTVLSSCIHKRTHNICTAPQIVC